MFKIVSAGQRHALKKTLKGQEPFTCKACTAKIWKIDDCEIFEDRTKTKEYAFVCKYCFKKSGYKRHVLYHQIETN